jgi:site-specific DNA recombinase
VSEVTFRTASEVLRANIRFSDRNARRSYLLRGLIRCANCGRTYTGRFYETKAGDVSFYECSGRAMWRHLGVPRCQSKKLRAADIEVVVWEDIKAFVKDPDVAIEQLRAKLGPQHKALAAQILVSTETVLGEPKSVVTITYRFDEPEPSPWAGGWRVQLLMARLGVQTAIEVRR